MLSQLYAIFVTLDEQIAWFDKEIEKVFRSSETCRRLAKIRGVLESLAPGEPSIDVEGGVRDPMLAARLGRGDPA